MFHPVELSIKPKKVFEILTGSLLFLVVLHIIAMQANFNPVFAEYTGIEIEYWHVSFFDLDEEEGFGTWFNSALLFFSSVLLYLKSKQLKINGAKWQKHWLALSIIFAILSIEEIAGIHEWINSFDNVLWTVALAPVVLITGLIFTKFFWANRWGTSLKIIYPIFIYLSGAMGVEFFTDDQVNSLHYNMWTALEESLEMFGIIVFIYVIMSMLTDKNTPEKIDIKIT